MGMIRRLSLLLVLFVAGAAVMAQEDAISESVAPARLGVADGAVWFWRPGAEGWTPAQLNAALVSGDAIHTADGSTAEIQMGPRDFVRLTANTMVSLAAYDVGLMQIRVSQGTASFDLRTVSARRLVQIDTPNASFIVAGAGYYRLDVGPDNTTRFASRNGGRATLSLADARKRTVSPGEQAVVVGADRPTVDVRAAPAKDGWDRWNDDRSDYYASAVSNRYVPADTYGVADLDRHGNWREAGDYGWVWVPDVASGWTPYSAGTWQWDPIYGWTWVDQAPWGWATSHYGRWVYLDGYWGWAPGPRGGRAIYAPALVSFTRLGIDGMSWVALGWGEPVIPWWGRPGFRGVPWWGGWSGPRFGDDIRTHRHYNRDVPNSVITIPGDDLRRYRPDGRWRHAPDAGEHRPHRGERRGEGTLVLPGAPVVPAVTGGLPPPLVRVRPEIRSEPTSEPAPITRQPSFEMRTAPPTRMEAPEQPSPTRRGRADIQFEPRVEPVPRMGHFPRSPVVAPLPGGSLRQLREQEHEDRRDDRREHRR